MVEGIGAAQSVASVREAVESADVVISVVSFGPDRQSIDPDWLEPEVLFIAVDYDMQAPAALAREAFFVVDERDQFLAARSASTFAGYPDPDATIGELLRGEGAARPGDRAPAFNSNGGIRNYDGFGRNAAGNDTLYLNGWLAF